MVVYMNDLLQFNKDEESHIEHLKIVLPRLNDQDSYVSLEKYEFMESEISFPGMISGNGGIKLNPKKVEV